MAVWRDNSLGDICSAPVSRAMADHGWGRRCTGTVKTYQVTTLRVLADLSLVENKQ